MKRHDIQIRDPFVLTLNDRKEYYLYGTTDKNCWNDKGTGFDCYKSADLENWDGPFPVFRPTPDFWADRHFWAPEVYQYKGKYYMFASFKSPNHCRGTQILISSTPDGSFSLHSDGAVTPNDWECLDGTLYIDKKGSPWMIFCREWLQVVDGQMWAMPLGEDLKQAAGNPILLFSASQAKWTKGSVHKLCGKEQTVYVTDGPYLYRTKNGKLLMLWSSGGEHGYAIGIAQSDNGDINGNWTHLDKPLFEKNGGHGMVFKSFDGKVFVSLHSPNNTPMERPCFFEVEEINDELVLKDALI
ncbi:MAG: glycoside hydrolase family 43 protein [Clostridia bacterium]|nr:glycoside hydrolase family 43 protein [Clostridia bacterium]